METKETFTDVEVLNDAISTISKLMVPVDMTEHIGMPLNRVRNNLMALLEAIQNQQKQQAEEHEEEPEISFTGVPKAEVEEI